MAALVKIGRSLVRPIISQRCALVAPVLRAPASSWNKDWKPGPYPETMAEREAAAKKYGLRVGDYEPYADDGTGYGDYPKLPTNSLDSRNLYENWDMPEFKRNFGEPLNVNVDMFAEERYNADMKYRYSWFTMYAMSIGVIGGIVLLYILAEPYPNFHPAMKKQYPRDGVHYTFEAVD